MQRFFCLRILGSLIAVCILTSCAAEWAVGQEHERPSGRSNSAESFAERGAAWLTKGQYDKAIADLDRAIELGPENVFALARRGEAWRMKGEHEKAFADLDRAIELNPNDLFALAARSEAWRMKAEYGKAIADLDLAIALNPRYDFASARRGDAWRMKAEYDKAILDLDRALELNPNYSDALAWRGDAWLLKGEYDKAIADLDRAIELKPNYAFALRARGEAWRMKAKDDKAIADLERAIELNPNSACALAGRGSAWRMKGEYDKAIADLDRAIELNPNSVFALAERGSAWRMKGEYDKAITDLDRAIEVNPRCAFALAERGEVWKWIGDRNRALNDLALAEVLVAAEMSMAEDDEEELLSKIQSWWTSYNWLKVHVVVSTVDDRDALSLFVLGGDKHPDLTDCLDACHGSVTSKVGWNRLVDFLITNVPSLQYAASDTHCRPIAWRPQNAESDIKQGVRCVFFPSRSRTLQVAENRQLHLTPRVLEFLQVQSSSIQPDQRIAVIIDEPHADLDGQVALFRAMEALFAANPWLAEDGETAFLAEGWAADRKLSIESLVKKRPNPSDALITSVLNTWLIPGYAAFAWKHQTQIPLIGHEDMHLHRISNYIHWGWGVGRWHEQNERAAGFAKSESVAARNQASGQTFVRALSRYKCPILFIGAGHVGPYPDDDQRRAPQGGVQQLFAECSEVITPEEIERLGAASHRSVVSYLQDEDIGYVLLVPTRHPGFGVVDQDRSTWAREYLRVRKAQHDGVYNECEVFAGTANVTERGNCTVMPAPNAVAQMIDELERSAVPLNQTAPEKRANTLWVALQNLGDGVFPPETPDPNSKIMLHRGAPLNPATRFVAGSEVRGFGKILGHGTIDLQPTIDRINAGQGFPHKNDGTVFENVRNPLPAQPLGYYLEFVVPTPGVTGPGPQRLVIGRNGEIFYTPDHYLTFIEIQ